MIEYEQKFIESVNQNYPKHGNEILTAYKFAYEKHDGILRKSGEPYIIHPLAVAQILIDNNMDYSTIMAGLLHDVVEDTEVTNDDIKNLFGDTVAKLVDGVTKIDALTCSKFNLTESDSIKHLLIAMGDDIRVIFIKLADRLHNMRTVKFLNRNKQISMAKETQELFIPIAERIGVRKLRTELQDLTFECLHPEEYYQIKGEFDRKFLKRKEKIEGIENSLKTLLSDSNISSVITSWPEQYFSIYKRQHSAGIGKIYNFLLIKVIVPTEHDCYKALGLIHKKFRPVPGQFVDYIAMPKKNGYQSIHSVLISDDSDITFKVLIRTEEMDKTCEYGVSASWQKKDSRFEYDKSIEKKNILKAIISGEENYSSNSDSFIDAIKTDLLPDVTWLLTPKLKPICVNADNPTVVDFAYAVHTSIGDNAIGAVVNGKKVSVTSLLSSGDEVEVLLSGTPKAPSRKWLFIAKTAYARKKIREYCVKHTTAKNIKLGGDILKDVLEKLGLNLTFEQIYNEVAKEFAYVSVEDMLASIGYGGVYINQIISLIHSTNMISNLDVPIEVDSRFAGIKLSLSKCCCPIFGDEIIGLRTKNAIAVHTENCTNIASVSPEKLIRLAWKNKSDRVFDVNLKITATDKINLASRIFGLISSQNVDISKIVAKKVNSKFCEIKVCFGVKNTVELSQMIEKIKTIPEIRTVERYFD